MGKEPDVEIDDLARKVIGAAIEVHRTLRPGYLESVYEEALAIEFDHQGIAYQRQLRFQVDYRGKPAGEGRLDFLVAGRLIVELKAIESVAPIHFAIVRNYLRAFNQPLGLILNFKTLLMKDGIHRILNTD